jgi:flagellar biosynthesis protein FlhB
MNAKTEQPTPRRLRRARQQGDSPLSAALVQAAGFVMVVMLAPAAAAALIATSRARLTEAVSGAAPPSALGLARDVAVLSLPVLLAAAAAASFVGLAQTGGVVAFQKTLPDVARLHPWLGLKQLFNGQRLFGIVRALLAAVLVGWFSIRLLLDHASDIVATGGNVRAALGVAGTLSQRLLWLSAGIGVALSIVDWAVARRSWLVRHRMSRQEVRQELKEAEGDPEVLAARRRAQRELLASAMVAAVKDASVVVVNPTHLAIALRYDADFDDAAAPRVIAQGRGDLARQILDAAHAWGVPVVQDVPLARALDELELGDDIPEALYEAVAEILRELWERETAQGPRSAGAE